MPFQKGNKLGKRFGHERDAAEAGRKPKSALPDLRDLFTKVLTIQGPEGYCMAELIIAKMAEKAAKGDAKCAEFVFDRAYWKPTQKVEQVGEVPITIKVVRDAGTDYSLEAENPA